MKQYSQFGKYSMFTQYEYYYTGDDCYYAGNNHQHEHCWTSCYYDIVGLVEVTYNIHNLLLECSELVLQVSISSLGSSKWGGDGRVRLDLLNCCGETSNKISNHPGYREDR